jgi:hypothetical protein
LDGELREVEIDSMDNDTWALEREPCRGNWRDCARCVVGLDRSTIGTITSSPRRAGSLAANHVIFNRPFSCIYAFDVWTPVQAGDRFYASTAQGQQHDAEAFPAGLELLEHMGVVAPAEVDDAVAIAPAVLKFVGELAPERGV